jgi:uncharacterized membrane protein YfhO
MIHGVNKSIIRANGAFMGVFVEPGTETIEFIYDPWTFKVGGIISILSLLILLALLIFWFKRRNYPKSDVSKDHILPTL